MKISTISVCLTITSEPGTHYEWVVLDLVQTSLCQSWVDVVTLGHTRPRPRPSPALHNLKQYSGTGLNIATKIYQRTSIQVRVKA